MTFLQFLPVYSVCAHLLNSEPVTGGWRNNRWQDTPGHSKANGQSSRWVNRSAPEVHLHLPGIHHTRRPTPHLLATHICTSIHTHIYLLIQVASPPQKDRYFPSSVIPYPLYSNLHAKTHLFGWLTISRLVVRNRSGKLETPSRHTKESKVKIISSCIRKRKDISFQLWPALEECNCTKISPH